MYDKIHYKLKKKNTSKEKHSMLFYQICFMLTLMRRADSFEKTLMLGKIEGRRRRGQ